MNIWRPIAITLVATAGFLVLVTAASADEPTPVHGDLNCDYKIDSGDALQLLGDLSNDGASQSAAPCVGAEGDRSSSDVDCDGTVGMGDVLAVLGSLARVQTTENGNCAVPGDSVGAPMLSLACGAGDELLTVQCRYDAGDSETEFDPIVDVADGAISNVRPTKSVACDPDDNCQFAASAEFLVTFDSPDPRDISVTACDVGACATRTLTVWP